MNRLVRTELLKQRSTRALVAGVIAAPIVAALLTVVILAAAGKHGNAPLGPDNLVQVLGAPAGAITLIAVVLGVLGMAGEFRHQTITTTFLASPRRRDVVLAKLFAQLLTGGLMGLLSLSVSAMIAVPWLRASGVDISVDGRAARVAAGLILSTALYGALGVAIAALVRNQTAAISVVLVWLLAVEGLFGELLAGSALLRWFPAAAGSAIVHAGTTTDMLSAPVAAIVFTTYVAAFAAAATRFTIGRDIT